MVPMMTAKASGSSEALTVAARHATKMMKIGKTSAKVLYLGWNEAVHSIPGIAAHDVAIVVAVKVLACCPVQHTAKRRGRRGKKSSGSNNNTSEYGPLWDELDTSSSSSDPFVTASSNNGSGSSSSGSGGTEEETNLLSLLEKELELQERIVRDVRAFHFHPLPERIQQTFSGRSALGLDPLT